MSHEYNDPYGNGTATMVSGANPDGGLFSRRTSRSYDARGQFPTSTKNALLQESTATYDPRWGTVLSQTDPNQVAVSWGYDGFGRKISETRPDGTTTSITYAACGGSNPCPSFDNGAVASYTVTTQSSGAAPATTYFDLLGRALRVQAVGLSGATILSDTQYDNQGRVARSSLPYFAADTVRWNTLTYDALGRVAILTEADGGVTTTTYQGPTTTVEQSGPDIATRSRTSVKNAAGQLVSLTDSLYPSQPTTYQYDALGNLAKVIDALGNQTTIDNDLHGRKKSIDDPDMGVWTYRYDSLGELMSQTDNNNQTKAATYDPLGRLKTRTTLEGTSTWTYDTATNGIGKIASVTGPNGPNSYQESFTYDSKGRPDTHTVTIDATNYTTTTTYNSLGLVDTTTYPSTSFAVKRIYNPNGYLTEMLNAQTNLRYWLANDNDALGHIVSETLGNNLTTISTYDPASGALKSLLTSGAPGIAQNEGFTFDVLGNLRSRTDYIQNATETYGYDALNRLKTVTGPSPKTFEYDVIGNIGYKSDVGTYAYNNTYIVNGSSRVRPHAVSGTPNASYSYDNNGNLLSGAGRTVTWTSFNKPAQIIQSAGTATLTYGASFNRVKKVTPTSTTIYVGGFYERVTTGSLVEHKHYVGAGRTLVAYTQRSTGVNDTRYLHTDHLGSVVSITDENGNVVQRLAYDAWGKRRKVDWTDPTTPITAQMTFGFTGHEMDDEVGLINMRAREYDPSLGRFMSADTTIDGISGQGLNRYSYVANNPLSYTDPTGHSWKKKLAHKLMGHGLPPDLAYLEAYVLKPRQDAFLLKHPQWQPVVKIVTDGIICIYSSGIGCAGGSATFNAEFDRHMCERSGGTTDQCNDVMGLSFATTFTTALVAGGVADQPWYVQVPANAAAGGFSAEAQGGDFRDGVLQSLKFAALYYVYLSVAGKTPMAHQRGNDNVFGDRVPESARAILDALTFDGREVTDFDLQVAGLSGCFEGSRCSQRFNNWPFAKPASWVHDPLMGSSPVGYPSEDFSGIRLFPRPPSNAFMSWLGNTPYVGPFVNYTLMFPSLAWTIGAMAYQIGVVPH